MRQPGKPWQLFLLSILLVSVTAAVFWPVLENGFLNYDDPDYVTENLVVREGLTGEGVRWAFSTGHASNWHPVTWLSHQFDVSQFGLRPAGHHATSLLLHLVNSILVLLLLQRMTGALWRSGFVAALFALHPLHVESVAWIAERKDVLSAFFGLLTLLAYVRYTEGNAQNQIAKRAWYAAALLLFALGLMSKPMLVTWPFAMLLLDVWPLNRIPLAASPFPRTILKSLVLEKLPFLLLTVISSWVTVLVQRGALSRMESVPLGERIGNAVLAVVRYLQQTFWPTQLAVFYPLPTHFPTTELIFATVVCVAIFGVSIRLARTQPWVLVGWLWFVGTLVPVIGLVQVGAQARADRYTYLPLIGIFWVLSWSLETLGSQRSGRKWLRSAAGAGGLIALGILCRTQIRYWHDDRTLYAHAAEVTTDNYFAWSGLGIADIKAANWPGAMTNLARAYKSARAHRTERTVSYYLGVALQMQGKPLDALPYLESCSVSAELRPERDHRLGLSLIEAGRLDEAGPALRSALAARPHNLNYQLGLAAFARAKGDLLAAETIHRDAVAAHPDSPLAFQSYADFLTFLNRPTDALAQYEMAVQLSPNTATYRRAYATALRSAGDPLRAAEQLEAAFLAEPATAPALLDLADLYYQGGQMQKVLASYNRANQLDPESISVLNNFAWFLATNPDASVRDGPRAVLLAERACTITEWKPAVLLGTLAAAYAEAGRFPDAMAMADKAIAQARESKLEDVARRNEELRMIYGNARPFHETNPPAKVNRGY